MEKKQESLSDSKGESQSFGFAGPQNPAAASDLENENKTERKAEEQSLPSPPAEEVTENQELEKVTTNLQPQPTNTSPDPSSAPAPTSGPATSAPHTAPAPTEAPPHLPSLLPSRPAPPSPASSRPSSTVISPDPSFISLSSIANAGASGSSSGSAPETGRDCSTSSASRAGRRVSTASSGGRLSLRTRPRSTLGASFSLPETEDVSPATEAEAEAETEVVAPTDNEPQTAITTDPEAGSAPGEGIPPTMDETESPIDHQIKAAVREIPVVIRDFAFVSTDERHHGRGAPIDTTDRDSGQGGGFSWSWRGGGGGGEDDAAEGSKKSWGGFGLLGGWRGFGSRQSSGGSGEDGRGAGNNDDDDDEDDDDDADLDLGIRGTEVDADAEDYFSSPSPSEMGDGDPSPSSEGGRYEYTLLPPLDEPIGLYRAAYPFEALSTNELQLVEGDLLEISGRGKGDPGWVIARRMRVVDGRVERAEGEGSAGRVGLVPEGYLERIEVVGA